MSRLSRLVAESRHIYSRVDVIFNPYASSHLPLLEAVGSSTQSNLQSFSRPRIQFLIWSDGTAAASDVTETDKRMMCTLLVNAILSYVRRSLCADDLGE